MKFVIAALIATVAAQEGEASLCETTADCDANFDAILEEWEADENPDKEVWQPVQGEMSCGKASLSGEDEEGNSAAFNVMVCMPNTLCDGFTYEGESEEGTGRITVEAGACDAAAGGDDAESYARSTLVGLAAVAT